MLPFSVDWFMTWLPNIHSSLFYSIYQFMTVHTPCDKSRALVEAYRLYLEQSSAGRLEVGPDEEPVFSGSGLSSANWPRATTGVTPAGGVAASLQDAPLANISPARSLANTAS